MSRLGDAAGFRGRRIFASSGVVPRVMRDGALSSLDPHAWQDPRNGLIYVREIAAGLGGGRSGGMPPSIGPTAESYLSEIDRLDQWITARFAAIPSAARRIITTHDAFGYYGDRYGITFIAAEGLATDAEPSAKAIRALVGQIRREGLHTVFLENMTDPRLAKMLARESGASLSGPLYSDALSAANGPAPDYLAMLRYNTLQFESAMRAG